MKCKRIAIILVLFFAVSSILSTSAFARASSQIMYYDASLSLQRDGDLKVSFYITTVRAMDTLGASSIAIQRYSNSSWITEFTFTPLNNPEIQSSNKSNYSKSVTYTPMYSNAT